MKLKANRTQLLLILGLGFLLYANTLNHGYVLDDFSVIKDNFVVKKGIEGIPTIFKTHYRYGYGFVQANLYRPLSLSLFAIQWEIAPDNPSFAHLCNVLAYMLMSCLLFVFLQLLWGKEYKWLVMMVVLLFVAHPIHTEVVANIKSIDDILAFGLSLGAMILLLQHVDQPNKKKLMLSLVLFGLACFAKESAVSIVPIIGLILVMFRGLTWKIAISKAAVYLLPFLTYVMARIAVLGSFSGNKTIAKIDNMLMAAPTEAVRLATAIKILGLYLWKLIFPHPLMNDYSLNQISMVDFGNQWVWFSILIYLSLAFAMVKLWRKMPIISFGIVFYFIAISLYSNLVFTIGTSFGERLLFIPSLGFCVVLAYLIYAPFQQKILPNKGIIAAKQPLLFVGLIVMAYGFKTIDRNQAWKDNYTLYTTDVENCDKSARCHYYHGLGLMKEKAMQLKDPQMKNNYLAQAVQAFDQAIQILPKYSDAWGQKGLAYYRLGDFQQADAAYKEAIKHNPNNVNVLSNWGSMYFENKRYQEAKVVYQQALKANPNHLDALANYGATLGTLGEYQQAIVYFKKAIALRPNEPNYYRMVGITYQNLGNQQQANIYLQKAQQLSR